MAEFTSVADPSPVKHVEVATLALARDVGIRAAKASLAWPDTLFRVTVVERFDRGGDGSSRRRHLSAQSFIGASKRDSDPRFARTLGMDRACPAEPTAGRLPKWRSCIDAFCCQFWCRKPTTT